MSRPFTPLEGAAPDPLASARWKQFVQLEHDWIAETASGLVEESGAASRSGVEPRRRRDRRFGARQLRKAAVRSCLRLSARLLPKIDRLPRETDVRTILVFGDMGIGNFIMFTPMLRALRNRFPSSRIVLLFLKGRGAEAVARRLDSVDANVCVDVPKEPTLSAVRKILRALENERARRPDVVIGRFNGSSYLPVITTLTRARWRVGHVASAGYIPFDDRAFNVPVEMAVDSHEIHRNLQLAAAVGAQTETPRLEFPVSEDDRSEWQACAARLALPAAGLTCLQAGSSEIQKWKRWPVEKWKSLLAELVARGHTIALVGSRDEHDLVDRIASGAPGGARVRNLCGELSLGATAALLASARLLVCNDSGLMHIAAALETPLIALFGPTEFDRTRPVGERARVLRRPCHCNHLTLFDRRTLAAIEQCDRPCLNGIEPRDVISEMDRLLGNAPP